MYARARTMIGIVLIKAKCTGFGVSSDVLDLTCHLERRSDVPSRPPECAKIAKTASTRDPPKMDPFLTLNEWWYSGTYLRMYRIQGYPNINCNAISTRHPVDPKMGPILGVVQGSRGPRFDAVFNKTACLAQSLYARARVGVWYSGQNHPKWTPFDPPECPLIPRIAGMGHFKGT